MKMKRLIISHFPVNIFHRLFSSKNPPCFFFFFLAQSIAENSTIGSVVGLLNAIDEDFNQTLTYSTDNPHFSINQNQLILQTDLDADRQPVIPVTVRVFDNGQPATFVGFRL